MLRIAPNTIFDYNSQGERQSGREKAKGADYKGRTYCFRI